MPAHVVGCSAQSRMVQACLCSSCNTCRERENNSKYLQTLSGATPAATWLSNFAWDAGIYGIAAAAMLALLAAHTLHVPQLDGPRAAALAAVLLAYGPASICLTYLAQQAFGVGGSAICLSALEFKQRCSSTRQCLALLDSLHYMACNLSAAAAIEAYHPL